MSYITDFHTHIGLKLANNENIKDLWVFEENKPPRRFFFFFNFWKNFFLKQTYTQYATFTQCNLENCVDGHLRVQICSIYPIERQYINRKNFWLLLMASLTFFTKTFPFIPIFMKKRNVLFSLAQIVIGISKKRSEEIWKEQKSLDNRIDYFKDYLKELQVLKDAQNSKSNKPQYAQNTFKLVRNYEEFQANIQNKNVLLGIISAEGIHSFGDYKLKHLFRDTSIESISDSERQKLLLSMRRNIDKVKKKDAFSPFYVTFAHHYNNLFCGHSKSFKFPITLFFKQKNALDKGLYSYGEQIIRSLLERGPEKRRVLIDIKHMSIETRKDFYKIIDEYNKDVAFEDFQNKVPIISSHTAVNGNTTWEASVKLACKKEANKGYVSRCDVNVCDEDILQIYKSSGIIGILMHDGRMPGKKYLKKLKALKEQPKERMLLQQQLFLTNVYHIIHVLYQKDLKDGMWDIITLGSDMDGLIDPFDDYTTAGDLLAFRNHIWEYLDNYETIPEDYHIVNLMKSPDGNIKLSLDELNALNMGLSTTEIVNRIFYKNFDLFLSRYFTDNYLFGN
ncbi:hypothetical protein [Winogradskyella sp.]|uniref:hypothetical protein n=1 Tax=Winogradskyella sp. TaxID=1883156 RepID=UPI00262E22DB|nr:hypothetical protein [Winogradskyella sp.]